ncbi:hypothetical protein [Paraburkholderia graminis]|uniref:hypothetical protein n=1 Tax=Paraburkholderia graminis TaxID=60548 RepID=UPI00286C899A|nr:hypothetical protein [Paraburkholderia graminis]
MDDPNSVIQQVLTEHEQDRRREFVDAQSEYVEYGKGTSGRYDGFGVTHSKHEVAPLYYRSIKEANVYQTRKHFIVQFRNAQDNLFATVLTDDGDAVRRLVDAVATMEPRQATH